MRPGLAIAGVAVLVAAIVVWLMMKQDEPAPSASPSTEPAEGATVAERPPIAPAGGTRNPALPSVTPTQAGAKPTGEVREYELDGKRVRDHREGDHPPIDLPPNVHPPEGRRIKPTLTGALADQVRAVMSECKQSVPPEAMGENPRLEGQIVIGIKDGKATISKSTIQLRDVVGAALEPTKQCIEQKSLGLGAPAGDEADLESYSINLTFAFR